MLHRDVERKGSLLARFIVDHLRDYADQVRDNLSLYLNTAEKIRIKVSRNSFILTDRSIFHNKIERIPISLIKECEVDHLSPKICYFANETVTNKYQVIVVLCKSADDSYRIVNLLKHKIRTQGYYNAHNHWLQNGSFPNDGEITPKTKRRTIASVEVVSSPRDSRKYVWGVKRSPNPSSSYKPSTPTSMCRDSVFSNGQGHEYINLDTLTRTPKSPDQGHAGRRDSVTNSVAHSTRSSKKDFALFSDQLPRDKGGRDQSTNKDIKLSKAHRRIRPNPGRDQHQTGSALYDPVEHDDDTEQQVVMRRPRCLNIDRHRPSGYTSLVLAQDAMRSSVVQYDSDVESNEQTGHLQHNSNGIARIVVGGNDENPDSTSSTPTADQQSVSETLDQMTGSSAESTDKIDRQCGDGATASEDSATSSAKIKEKQDVTTVCTAVQDGESNSLINSASSSLDGVYDNVESTKDSSSGKTDILNSVDEMIRSYDMSESNKKSDSQSQHEDPDEEEYELVLTGLKQLTGGSVAADGSKAELRYPHQVVAAMSTSQILVADEAVNEDPCEEMKVQNVSQTAAMPSVPAPQLREKSRTTVAKPIQRCSKSMGEQVVNKARRPQSVSSGLHLVRTNNELRRSTRRKGQYTSIAEYEKVQGQSKSDYTCSVLNSQPQSGEVVNAGKSVSPKQRHKPRMASPSITSQSTGTAAQSANRLSVNEELRKHASRKSMIHEKDGNSRRTSIISITSAPNNVLLRRVSNVNETERKVAAERKSKSFDRKVLPLSVYKQSDEGVSQNGLTLVGSRSSLISHGRSSITTDPRLQQHNRSTGHLSLGEPSIAKGPVLDGKKSRPQPRPASRKTSLQWTPLPEIKKKSKIQYISLPNTPDMHLFRNQPINLIQTNWKETTWDQKPGFKRFFDSILTYGPNGSKSNIKQGSSRHRVHTNQPDIVLESLTPEHSTREDDSDTDSSIRSSASAYWPPELKYQTNCDLDFEEAASWQFHNPVGQNKKEQYVNVL